MVSQVSARRWQLRKDSKHKLLTYFITTWSGEKWDRGKSQGGYGYYMPSLAANWNLDSGSSLDSRTEKSCSMCQHLEICLSQGKVGFAGVLKLSWLKTTKLFFFPLPHFTSCIGWELTHVILTLELHIPRIIEAGNRGYGDSLTSPESFFLLWHSLLLLTFHWPQKITFTWLHLISYEYT